MYRERTLFSRPDWFDADGIKLYAIAFDGREPAPTPFLAALDAAKRRRAVDWAQTPAFAILHAGDCLDYLVLCWWGNGNELFVSVSVRGEHGWWEDRERASFCLHDMEVMAAERVFYIECIDCAAPDLGAYRSRRLPPHPGAT